MWIKATQKGITRLILDLGKHRYDRAIKVSGILEFNDEGQEICRSDVFNVRISNRQAGILTGDFLTDKYMIK